jgi:hypothetical protein
MRGQRARCVELARRGAVRCALRRVAARHSTARRGAPWGSKQAGSDTALTSGAYLGLADAGSARNLNIAFSPPDIILFILQLQLSFE